MNKHPSAWVMKSVSTNFSQRGLLLITVNLEYLGCFLQTHMSFSFFVSIFRCQSPTPVVPA